MLRRSNVKLLTLSSVIAASLLISACSSSDDDDDAAVGDNTTIDGTDDVDGTDGTDDVDGADGTDGTDDVDGTDDTDGADDTSEAADVETVSFFLDNASTVPFNSFDGARGEGSFTVDTTTGAIAGSVTVEGTSGVPTMAHIHRGAVGVAGGIAIGLEGNDDGTVWTVPEGAVLDTPDLALFEADELYVNVHTEANASGEVRGQIVDSSAAGDTAGPGTVTISFTNTSIYQPMTPPVVALHNSPDGENGIRLFEVGAAARPEVADIAENGNNPPLVALAMGQIDAGTVTAAGVAIPDPTMPGPLLPGGSSEVTLDLESDDQVLSLVSMVVCTNDGFSGVDSHTLSADASETFLAPIYDAGSEVNDLDLEYWVGPQPCGGSGANLHTDEGGVITAHPGQAGSPANFDFPAGTAWLEVTITRN